MIKDRLGDLVADDDDDDDDNSTASTNAASSSSSMQALLAEAEELRRQINSIQTHVDEAKRLHSDILSAPRSDEKLRSRLDELTADVRRTAGGVRCKLKLLQPDYGEDDRQRADLRIRRAQHAALTSLFVEAMLAYNRAQLEHRGRCKARIKRQLEIAGRPVDDDVLEDMLERQAEPAVFAQAIVVERETSWLMRQTHADIEARHADIRELEKSIGELNAMFMDMAVLVESQGALVDNVEHHVGRSGRSVDFAAEGARNVERGGRYQSKARRKIIFAATCLLLLLLLLIVVIFVVGR